jgi:hypothetical protein
VVGGLLRWIWGHTLTASYKGNPGITQCLVNVLPGIETAIVCTILPASEFRSASSVKVVVDYCQARNGREHDVRNL